MAALQALLEAGADLAAASGDRAGPIGRTALHWAAAKGKEEACLALAKVEQGIFPRRARNALTRLPAPLPTRPRVVHAWHSTRVHSPPPLEPPAP